MFETFESKVEVPQHPKADQIANPIPSNRHDRDRAQKLTTYEDDT